MNFGGISLLIRIKLLYLPLLLVFNESSANDLNVLSYLFKLDVKKIEKRY